MTENRSRRANPPYARRRRRRGRRSLAVVADVGVARVNAPQAVSVPPDTYIVTRTSRNRVVAPRTSSDARQLRRGTPASPSRARTVVAPHERLRRTPDSCMEHTDTHKFTGKVFVTICTSLIVSRWYRKLLLCPGGSRRWTMHMCICSGLARR